MFKKLAAVTAVMTILAATPVYAGQWVQDSVGWRWQFDDGSYKTDGGWAWIDGNHDGIAENYQFDYKTGYMTYDTRSDITGVYVDENGALLYNGAVATDVIPDGSDYFSGMAEEGKIWYAILTPDESVHELNAKIQAERDQKEAEKARKEAETEAETEAWIESIDTDKVAQYIAELVNEERAARGCSELIINDELMENAAVRAEEISEVFSHIRPDGSKFNTVYTAHNYGVAENIAARPIVMGETEEDLARNLMDQWMNSSGHFRNIINTEYNEVGVGVYRSGDYLYSSQLFIITK